MAYYEHVVLTRPDISPQQVDALVEEVSKTVQELGGSVSKTEYWGLRNLAYRVRKNRKAHYSLVAIDGPPNVVAELERRQRINEDVLRFKTIRVEEISEDASPILARRDRDERRRRRDDEGGYGEGGEE